MRIWALEGVALLHMVCLLAFLPLSPDLGKCCCTIFMDLWLWMPRHNKKFACLLYSWSCAYVKTSCIYLECYSAFYLHFYSYYKIPFFTESWYFTLFFYSTMSFHILCCSYRANFDLVTALYQITEVLLGEDQSSSMIAISMSRCS